MSGQTCSLLRDAFHQVAVADDGIDMVGHDVKSGPVVVGRQPLFGNGHTHAVGKSLSQRTSRGLDPGRVAVFRVAGCLAAPLAKVFQLLQGQIVTGQMEQGVEQHRTVAGAENKAITIRPFGICRTVAKMPAPERQRGCGHAHWQAGVAPNWRLARRPMPATESY